MVSSSFWLERLWAGSLYQILWPAINKQEMRNRKEGATKLLAEGFALLLKLKWGDGIWGLERCPEVSPASLSQGSGFLQVQHINCVHKYCMLKLSSRMTCNDFLTLWSCSQRSLLRIFQTVWALIFWMFKRS